MSFKLSSLRRLKIPTITLRLPRFVERILIGLSLTAYAALLAYIIPRHEPWADEAQAWELAKTLSLKNLFGVYIHYEASPGLWHVLLWFLARMHLTYNGMHWFAGLLVLAAMAMLLIAAPFPLPVRLLLPFNYFFAFQYSVVARNYALFPILLFALACLWKRRHARPLPVAILIALLANVSAHGLAVAVGLVIILIIERLQNKDKQACWRSLVPCIILLAATIGFAAWCMIPAPNAGWAIAAANMQSKTGIASMVSRTRGYHSAMHHLPFDIQVGVAELLRFTQALGQGLTDKFNIGLIIWSILAWGWFRDRLLRYSLPILLLAEPFPSRTFNFYHAGLSWVLLLFLWWITWPERDPPGSDPKRESPQRDPQTTVYLRYALLACICQCIAIHLNWAVSAIRYDAAMPYSPNRDGAVILHEYLDRGDRVDVAVPSDLKSDGYGQFYVMGMEPYFASQPIANMPFRFWFWGPNPDMRPQYLRDSDNQSAIIVVEETEEDPRYHVEEEHLLSIGYRRDKVVCGQIFYPDGMNLPLCHAFFQPTNQTLQ